VGHHLRLVSLLPSKQPQWRYRLHTAANHEDAGRGRPTIGLLSGWQVHDGTPDSFLHQVFHGVHAAAREVGCNLLVGYGIGAPRDVGWGRPSWPMLLDDADFVPVGPSNCDGLVVVTPVSNPDGRDYFKRLLAHGYPVVFAACLDEFGLEYDPALIAYSQHTIAGGQRAMAQILERKVPFSAVMASNDSSAVGAVTALRAAGLSVPEDVAIIGFDDRIEARALSPQLPLPHV